MRALSRNTRRVTALTLAAALVIAVYLNWQYARTDTGIAADEEAQVVSAEPVQSDTVLVRACPRKPKQCRPRTKTMGKHSWSAWQATAAQSSLKRHA